MDTPERLKKIWTLADVCARVGDSLHVYDAPNGTLALYPTGGNLDWFDVERILRIGY